MWQPQCHQPSPVIPLHLSLPPPSLPEEAVVGGRALSHLLTHTGLILGPSVNRYLLGHDPGGKCWSPSALSVSQSSLIGSWAHQEQGGDAGPSHQCQPENAGGSVMSPTQVRCVATCHPWGSPWDDTDGSVLDQFVQTALGYQ